MIRKIFVGVFLLFVILFFAVPFAFGLFINQKITTFCTAAGVEPKAFFEEIKIGFTTEPTLHEGRKNVLILGLDVAQGRDNSHPLTDTILFASFYPEEMKANFVPIPRDLWIREYQTKINALYAYGSEKNATEPAYMTKEVVEKITGKPVHHIVTLGMNDVADIVDVLGGVDVNIEHSFTDELFPREGVDVTKVHDPKILYETVTFAQGVEHMNGVRALQFMRSRHSKDVSEGTDEARAARQQLVIQAVVKRIKSIILTANAEELGKLFKYYRQRYDAQLPFREMLAILSNLAEKQMQPKQFSTVSFDMIPYLSVPPIKKYKQWVYEPKDVSWKEINDAVAAFLK